MAREDEASWAKGTAGPCDHKLLAKARASATEAVNDAPRHYLNRLSDLLFVLARVLNRANLDGLGGDDVYWRSEKLAAGVADDAAESAAGAG